MKNAVMMMSKADRDTLDIKYAMSGEDSFQTFMTKMALEVINSEFESRETIDPTISVQFRLDNTLHQMIKEKAQTLNRDMTELFKEVILK